MATPTLAPLTSRPAGAPAPPAPGDREHASGWASRLAAAWHLLALGELALALLALLGGAVCVATLTVGRSALFWPGASWLAVALVTLVAGAFCWWLGARTEAGERADATAFSMRRADRSGSRSAGGSDGRRTTNDERRMAISHSSPRSAQGRLFVLRRHCLIDAPARWRPWQAAAWPVLALLPAAALAAALYLDDASHHLIATYPATRQALLAYLVVLFGGAQALYWWRRSWRADSAGLRPASVTAFGAGTVPPVVLGIAAAMYLDASIYAQWLPAQADLHINLRGARELLQGILPYHDTIPVWADRVHHLPVTLALFFGPLAALPERVAHTGFFLANQVFWLAGCALFVWRQAPPGRRAIWLTGALVFGAAYWPWQEAIRFGQQDGLLVLLYVMSLVAAAHGRDLPAGIALGLALVIKPLSIWLPLAFLIHGRWRALAIAAGTGLALTLAALPWTGVDAWLHFWRVEVPAMLPGTVRGTNIPLASLHARFFVGREALSDGEAAPMLAAISALNLAASALGLLLMARVALRRDGDRRRAWLLDFSLGLTLTLLLAPMAWQHYASWLTIAFLVLALPAVWQPLPGRAQPGLAILAGTAFLCLSLEDGKLVRLLNPLIDFSPAVLAFYPLGLLCLAVALAAARFGANACARGGPVEQPPVNADSRR